MRGCVALPCVSVSLAFILISSVSVAEPLYCIFNGTNFVSGPQKCPGAFAEIAENFQNTGEQFKIARGVLPYIAATNIPHGARIDRQHIERRGNAAVQVVDAWSSAVVLAKEENQRQLALLRPLAPLLRQYRTAMETLFGPGAVTNRALTDAVIAQRFLERLQAGTLTEKDSCLLDGLHEARKRMLSYSADGTAWGFRWDLLDSVDTPSNSAPSTARPPQQ